MLKNETIVYLVGRDHWQADDEVNRILVSYLRSKGYHIEWEDPAGWLLYDLRRWQSSTGLKSRLLKSILLRVVQTAFCLVRPSYLWYLRDRKSNNVELRCKRLLQQLVELPADKKIVVFGRSSGARVASKVADKCDVSLVVALGYPFKHPECDDEPDRYQHLATINTPTLIVQGDADIYGDATSIQDYELSPSVSLCVVEGGHGFQLSPDGWSRVLSVIDSAITDEGCENAHAFQDRV